MPNNNNKYKIDFKYNLNVFWSFLKNYKLMVALLIIVVILQQSKNVLDKFLFKLICPVHFLRVKRRADQISSIEQIL